MDRRLWAVILGGCILRLLLSATALPQILLHRNELSTPLTSWTRLKEGHYITSQLDRQPYTGLGGSFHHAPLLLLLGPLTGTSTSPWVAHVVWTVVEAATAWLLGDVARRRQRTLLKGEKQWSAAKVAAVYLLHPFALGASLARSTIVFSNLLVALAVQSAVSGTIIPAVFALSLATHVSFYPALLLPPLVLVAAQHGRSQNTASKSEMAIKAIIGFALHQAFVLLLSRLITGGWQFLGSSWGVILTLPDLTPTIGLAWYFFIEMFDHFRAFFVGVFQLHVASYVAPLTFHYRHDPLSAVTLLVGIIAIFKSYPELGEFALWHALLANYSELHSYLSHPLTLTLLTLYSLALLPTFHHLWLYSGQGNANFFYASTLVWTLSQGGTLVEFLWAHGRKQVMMNAGLGEEGRDMVRMGKWKLVQR